MRGLVVAMGVAASVLTGCGDDGPSPDDCDGCGGPPPPSTESTCTAAATPSASPALVLGIMDGGSFTPLTGGEQVQMHYGGQGGTHFEIAAQLFTGDEQLWTLDVDILLGGNPVAETTVTRNACGSEWLELDIPVFGSGDGAAELVVVATPDGQAEPGVSQSLAIELVDPEAGI